MPQLRPILTPAEAKQLDRAISNRVARARAVLRSVEGKTLTRQQSATVRQIVNFIGQAEAAQKTDLQRAGNLAERAEVLADDLARQIR
jgi:uncharacterized hydantoinase/oxoprolinase family protein